MTRRWMAFVAGGAIIAGAGTGIAQQSEEGPAQPVPRYSGTVAPAQTAGATPASATTPKATSANGEREILIYNRPGAAPARTPRPKRTAVSPGASARCTATVIDAFFEPTQGVFQDDPAFRAKTPQLIREESASRPSYRAALDMVRERPTVLVGVETFVDAAGVIHAAGDRHRILFTVRSDCAGIRKVKVDFDVRQKGLSTHFQAEPFPPELPIAPPRLPNGKARIVTVAVDASEGFPADRSFTFAPGPWTIRASILNPFGFPISAPIEESGQAVATTAPVTTFAPLSFTPSQGNFALISGEAVWHAEGFARMLADYWPLGSDAVRAPVSPPIAMLSGGALPAIGNGIAPQDRFAAAVADRLELAALLARTDRVVGVVDDEEWHSIFTDPVDARETAGLAMGGHAAVVRASESILTDAHELTHTFPAFAWSSAGMIAECGRNAHDAEGLGRGMRLTSAGLPALPRREFEGEASLLSRPVPGPASDPFLWADKCTWAHLLGALQAPPRDQRVLLVRGALARQDDGVLRGAFAPFYSLDGTVDLQPSKPGSTPAADAWSFVLLDKKGKTLQTYSFTPSWRYEDDPVPDRAVVPFAFRIPWNPDAREMQLLGPYLTADKRKLAPTPPSLRITAPFEAASVRAHEGRVRVSWQATGTNGGSVFYSVLDSIDGGKTWMPIVLELSEGFVEMPAAIGKHKVKVVVTDGASSRETITAFTVR